MVPKPKSQSLLVTILESLRLKLAKSFSPAFVSDVYSKISSYEDVDDLLASSYFQNIAWKFFHADVTNNHLELILLMAFYEFEYLNSANCFLIMAEDQSRLKDLLLRVLQSTLVHQEANSRLEAAAFLFLSAQMRYDSSLLLQCKLYPKWIETVPKPFMSQLLGEPKEDVGPIEHFLYFTICASISLDVLRETFHPFRISARLAHNDVEPHPRIQKLASMLSDVLYGEEDGKSFLLKKVLLQSHEIASFYDVIHAPSKYDVDREKFISCLSGLDQAKLEEIAVSLGYEGELSLDFLPHVIAEIVLGHNLSTVSCSTLTEHELFDYFEESTGYPLSVPLSMPTTKQNFLTSIKEKAVLDMSKNINTHMINCLNRLTITDPSNENGIRGSSKYFLRPSGFLVEGASAKLSMKKLFPDIKPGERVVLLEMQKPNKYDSSYRMQKYGIFTARVARVISASDESITIGWKFPGFEKRFNAMVRLPQSFSALEALEKAIGEYTEDLTLKATGDKNQLNLEVSVDSVAYETLLEITTLPPIKKRRSGSITQDVFDYNGSKVVLGKKYQALLGPQAKVLLDMVTLKTVHFPGSSNEFFPAVVEFLQVVSQNWPKEKCLIVVPHAAAVQLFPVCENLLLLKYRDASEIARANQLRDSLLGRVSKLAAHLGLGQYDFGSSVRNALMLYHCHVKPRWEQYLGQLAKLKENAVKYPFHKEEAGDGEHLEQLLLRVVDHYASIKAIFAELQQIAPLSLDCTADDIHVFLAKQKRHVVAAVEDAATLACKFDRIVLFGGVPESQVPVLRSQPRLVAVFGMGYLAPGKSENLPNAASGAVSRTEIARLYGEKGVGIRSYNLGLKYAVQNVSVPFSSHQVNVEEAKYCVYLFQYLRLLGYPHHRILVVVNSPFMYKLIEEVLEEQKIGRNSTACDDRRGFRFGWPLLQHMQAVFPADYVIVSTHGDMSFRKWNNALRSAALGFYSVGSTAIGRIQNGPFELYTGGSFVRGTDHRENSECYVIEDAAHMGEYIAQMTKARTA